LNGWLFDISNECLLRQDLYMGTNWFYLLTLMFDIHIENFNHAHILWLVCTNILIFHIGVCCDKMISVGTNRFDFVYLTFMFDLLTENLILAISFEWYVLGFWYFTWVFVVTRPFRGYQQVWHCYLDLYVWHTYWRL
jgi:hypothetical protein